MSDMPERVFVSPLENDANGATVREAFSRQAVRGFFCEPYIRADLYEFQRETIAAMKAENERLRKALTNTLSEYVQLVNSGDCGSWQPDKEGHVIDARAALQGEGDRSE